MTVNSLWISDTDELPIIPVMSIKSWLKNGHQFVLWTYQKTFKNLPAGCILKNAEEVVSQSRIYKDVFETCSHFSDLWRWTFLYEKGGFWTDLDVICLKKTVPEIDGIHLCRMDDDIDSTAIGTLMFPAKHPLCKTMAKISEKPYKITEFDNSSLIWMKKCLLEKYSSEEDRLHYCPYTAIYRIVGAVAKKYNLDGKVLSHDYVYPVKYTELHKLSSSTFKLSQFVTENTFAIHLWNSHIAKTMRINVMSPCILKELYDMYYSI